MIKYFLIFLNLIFSGCEKSEKQFNQQKFLKKEILSNETNSKKDVDSISTNYDEFYNLKEFDVEKIISIEKLLPIKVDKEIYQKLFGNNVITNPEPIMGDYLLSRQNRNNGLKEEVILTGDRFYVTVIAYVIYDKENNVKTTFELARSGGDMGYFERVYGYFENDTIYHRTKIAGKPHVNALTNEPDLNKPAITDTTQSIFLISKTGVVKKQR